MDYELLDFGRGRRLERFGDVVLDRIAPSATGEPHHASRWREADASFAAVPNRGMGRNGEQRGVWKAHTARGAAAAREPWRIALPYGTVEMRLTPFGHVGLFPEQHDNWKRIASFVRNFRSANILNMFAYTGGSTLAAVTAGGVATHLDASRGMVAWARRNAEMNGLEKAPVRWVADDALKFVERERRRGRRYHGIVLDPPSFGHGPRGERWQLADDIQLLLDESVGLLDPASPRFVLLTCHTTGVNANSLDHWLTTAVSKYNLTFSEHEKISLDIATASKKKLTCGCGVWMCG
ncbi:MAG: class I SAM-dependent methyltransferase [Thermoguttaceae bacterium]